MVRPRRASRDCKPREIFRACHKIETIAPAPKKSRVGTTRWDSESHRSCEFVARALVADPFCTTGPGPTKMTTKGLGFLACALVACHSKGPEMDVPKLGELRFSLTPPSVSLPPGGVYPVEVILERPSGFMQPVTVTVNGLPSGVTASPLSIAGNTGVFTLSASADARSPRTEAMVSAASSDGMLSASRTLALVVEAPDAGFSLALTPATITLSRGSTGSTRVSVIRHSFSGAVTVTVSGLPPG